MKKLMPLLICLLFIFSCVSAAQERSLKKLPDADFSVEIPDGWWKPEYTNKYPAYQGRTLSAICAHPAASAK